MHRDQTLAACVRGCWAIGRDGGVRVLRDEPVITPPALSRRHRWMLAGVAQVRRPCPVEVVDDATIDALVRS